MRINVIWNQTFSVEADNDSPETKISVANSIRQGHELSITDSMEFVHDFHQIPSDVAENIMKTIIDRVAENEKNEEDTILKLINMGFPGKILVDYFGFNMISVGEVEENIFEKNKDSLYKRFGRAAEIRDHFLSDEDCERLIEHCEKEGSSVDTLIRMSDEDIQIVVDDYLV